MGNGFQFVDIIIFAAIAVFLVIRLRSVLGKRTGHEKKPDPDRYKRRGKKEPDDKVIQLPNRGKGQKSEEDGAPEEAESETLSPEKVGLESDEESVPAAPGITRVKLADSAFDEDGFLGGARAAFEMIVSAFAQDDEKALKPLLSNEVFDNFSSAIRDRKNRKETLETTLIGISDAQILEAEMKQKTAFVTVKFVSEQVNITRDEKGDVVDGDPKKVAKITDIWTFARNTRSRDPNWTLVSTSSES